MARLNTPQEVLFDVTNPEHVKEAMELMMDLKKGPTLFKLEGSFHSVPFQMARMMSVAWAEKITGEKYADPLFVENLELYTLAGIKPKVVPRPAAELHVVGRKSKPHVVLSNPWGVGSNDPLGTQGWKSVPN